MHLSKSYTFHASLNKTIEVLHHIDCDNWILRISVCFMRPCGVSSTNIDCMLINSDYYGV